MGEPGNRSFCYSLHEKETSVGPKKYTRRERHSLPTENNVDDLKARGNCMTTLKDEVL